MRTSTSLLFKSFHEFVPKAEINNLPKKMRGIYALYKSESEEKFFNLMYVGMTDSGAKGRILSHSKNKAEGWTHCSIFEVWDNITLEQIQELEALFLHVLRKDSSANALNIQKGSKVFRTLKDETRRRKLDQDA